jgi:malate dehydrogenase (oxaloacetate-decarboxylating)(NADP+)
MISSAADAPRRLRGMALLRAPQHNKGTAFSAVERERLGLEGLLPPRVLTLEQQAERVMQNFRRKQDDLDKYIFMIALQERNEVLFYRVVMDNIEEMMPILYTPTVGRACQEYAHIFRKPQGLFIPIEARGRVGDLLRNWPDRDVEVIVATDGERILGLGDLGANGMGIPVGKLTLYTSVAGIDPARCLPVMLDVGTNNSALIEDPLYFGSLHARATGADYDAFIEEFMNSAAEQFPDAILQFEDFANHNAFRLLADYRDRLRAFNDDIQGTGAVTLAGLITASRLRASSGKARGSAGGDVYAPSFTELKVLFVGTGEASIGAGQLVMAALQEAGLSHVQARARCWFMDSRGLVVESRQDLAEYKRAVAHAAPQQSDLLEVVRQVQPNAIIGTTGTAGVFTQEVVLAMGEIDPRPIIFALSNPTANSECTALQAYTWTDGRAIFASGSPFAPVKVASAAHTPGQANNVYIFPAIGLGTLVANATHISDAMFLAAARALAGAVDAEDLAAGRIFPPLQQIRDVTVDIAVAVAEVAYASGLAQAPRPDDLRAAVAQRMYRPEYEILL